MTYQKTVKINDVFLLVEFNTETEKFSFEKFYKKSDIPKPTKETEKEETQKEETQKKETSKEEKIKSDFLFFDED